MEKPRDSTPGVMHFMRFWKDKTAEISRIRGKKRGEMAEELDVFDGEMQSRYDNLHRSRVLITLVDALR